MKTPSENHFSAVLAEADELARRARLIAKADYTCQKCEAVAWKHQLMAQMQLRPKESVAGHPPGDDWVLCRGCADAHDAKKRRRAS